MDSISFCGKREDILLPVPKASPIPAVLLKGPFPGKTLVMTAGVHGCEYIGIQAVRELIHEISFQSLHGQILFVPLINRTGFYRGSKQIVPEDGKNLNRCFPGSSQGSLSYRLAYALEHFLYPKADFLLDLHSGDVNESMSPLVFFPAGAGEQIERITRDASLHLSVDYLVASRANNGLYSYAAQHQIPALLLERGGGGNWNPDEVAACKKNIRELLAYLDILPGCFPTPSPVEIDEACYEEAPFDGFWYCHTSPGFPIKKGDILGEIQDFPEKTCHPLHAKFDGVVLYHTHALGVGRGDALIAYGRSSLSDPV